MNARGRFAGSRASIIPSATTLFAVAAAVVMLAWVVL